MKTTLKLCEKEGVAFVARRTDTKEYLRKHVNWTKDIRKARTFFRTCDVHNCINYCHHPVHNPMVDYEILPVKLTLLEK